MRAVLLVGGEGTRLRPLTYDTPKQLLSVAGLTMLERVLSPLVALGVDEVVLSLGYRPDGFLAEFPDHRAAGLRLAYVREPEPLDTAGAIRFALEGVGATDERVVAMNGDVIADWDLEALLSHHEHLGAAATIGCVSVEDPSAFGVVVRDDAGWVERFVEKPPPGTAPSHLVNAGVYLLEAEAVATIPAGRRVSIERETFPALAAGRRLAALEVVPPGGRWIDCGTPEKYVRANLEAAGFSERSPGRSRSWRPVGSPPGLGADPTAVDPTAVVEEAVLGRGVTVGPHAVVRRSVLHEGVSVGATAVVEEAVVGAGARIGRGALLRGWTVVQAGAEVPPGAVLEAARVPRVTAGGGGSDETGKREADPGVREEA